MIAAAEIYKQYIMAENFYKSPHFVDLKHTDASSQLTAISLCFSQNDPLKNDNEMTWG